MSRVKTGDKCCRRVQFAKKRQILAITLAVRGFHAGLQSTKCREEKETRDETLYHVIGTMWLKAYWWRKW